MRYFLDFVLRRLVANAEDIDIREVDTEPNTKTFHVTVHPDDVGKVIGKSGRTIGAIRSLLTAAGAKTDQRVVVEVVENS